LVYILLLSCVVLNMLYWKIIGIIIRLGLLLWFYCFICVLGTSWGLNLHWLRVVFQITIYNCIGNWCCLNPQNNYVYIVMKTTLATKFADLVCNKVEYWKAWRQPPLHVHYAKWSTSKRVILIPFQLQAYQN
jgi:hypothetical protein